MYFLFSVLGHLKYSSQGLFATAANGTRLRAQEKQLRILLTYRDYSLRAAPALAEAVVHASLHGGPRGAALPLFALLAATVTDDRGRRLRFAHREVRHYGVCCSFGTGFRERVE